MGDEAHTTSIRQTKTKTSQFHRRVLEQAEALTKLLFDLDGVLSDGDATVRQERKAAVQKIQELLERADAMATESQKLVQFGVDHLQHMLPSTKETKEVDEDARTETSSVDDHLDDLSTSAQDIQDNIDTNNSQDDTKGFEAFMRAMLFPSEENYSELARAMQQEKLSTTMPIRAIEESTEPGQEQAEEDSPKKTIHVHVNGQEFVTKVQGDTTHIYINVPEKPQVHSQRAHRHHHQRPVVVHPEDLYYSPAYRTRKDYQDREAQYFVPFHGDDYYRGYVDHPIYARQEELRPHNAVPSMPQRRYMANHYHQRQHPVYEEPAMYYAHEPRQFVRRVPVW
ncbi:Aste57867_23231 [Aphanomyces stellatus]|nr:hypothetical protein As57867_023160 [Aphanomyces stellatus]VFT99876.1 Aste57867_23231 [Aphanomyces stellatus]